LEVLLRMIASNVFQLRLLEKVPGSKPYKSMGVAVGATSLAVKVEVTVVGVGLHPLTVMELTVVHDSVADCSVTQLT
jgi:hypothetical protein